MKVLIIYAKNTSVFWNFKPSIKYLGLFGKKSLVAPLGPLTVSSLLPKKWERRFVDLNVKKRLKRKDLLWADIIFLSANVSTHKESVDNTIIICREYGKLIAAGGPFFTLQPEKYKGKVDYLILGEAEITLPLFIKDYEKGEAKSIYKPESNQWADITKTPPPDWSLIYFNDYCVMPVQFSRGCNLDCYFCNIGVLCGYKLRPKNPVQIVNEEEKLYRSGWRGTVMWVDDNLSANKKDILKETLILVDEWQRKKGYPFKRITQVDIGVACDEELKELLKNANFNELFIGIETPSQEGLKECGKKKNLSVDLEESISKVHKNGQQLVAGAIMGLDSDPINIDKIMEDFFKKSKIPVIMLGLLCALPETKLWYKLKAEGRLIEDLVIDNTSGITNIILKMGIVKLRDLYKKVLTALYINRRNYYQRATRFMQECIPSAKSRVSWDDIFAFIKSIFSIGIFSKSSPYYWTLLFRTIFTNRKAFPIAVKLAIQHVHLLKYAKGVIKTI